MQWILKINNAKNQALTQCQAPHLLIKRSRLDSLFNFCILVFVFLLAEEHCSCHSRKLVWADGVLMVWLAKHMQSEHPPSQSQLNLCMMSAEKNHM